VVKAVSDYCCTSSNAVKVVQAIPEEKEVLFIPDFYLGTWVKRQTVRKNLHVWKGYCAAHTAITPEGIDRLREQHPDAEFLMHPECGCMTKSMDLADAILSTEGMVKYAKESPSEEFIIATEVGMLYKLQKENPGKKFYPASENATCQYMQMNTLEKAFRAILELKYEVKVPKEIADLARLPIGRMMAISTCSERSLP
jgi:quinolinate synthase